MKVLKKSLISIKVRLGAHHEAILRHILVYLMILEIYLHKQMKLKCVGIKKAVLVSTLKVDVVKPAEAMELLRLKCTFYLMFTFLVKFVMGSDIILKR